MLSIYHVGKVRRTGRSSDVARSYEAACGAICRPVSCLRLPRHGLHRREKHPNGRKYSHLCMSVFSCRFLGHGAKSMSWAFAQFWLRIGFCKYIRDLGAPSIASQEAMRGYAFGVCGGPCGAPYHTGSGLALCVRGFSLS